MTRVEMVKRLMNEGLSQKTLVNFTDNQLKSLCDRMLSEQTQVMMNKFDVTKPKEKAILQGMLKDPVKNAEALKRTTFEGEMKEGKKKPTQKQLSVLDKNKNKELDKQDFELLRKGKTSKKSEVKESGKLNGNQTKLDANKNGKIDKEDFKMLRSKKSEVKKGEKWIQKAIHPSKEGSLKKALGVKKDEKIPETKLKSAAKKGGKLGQRARLAMTLKKLKENHEISEWVNNLAETNYHPFTSKGEIMELLQRKINENETMVPMPKKGKIGHNGIPEFMTYDAIMSDTTTKPVVAPPKPGTKEKPFGPKPSTNPAPNAGIKGEFSEGGTTTKPVVAPPKPGTKEKPFGPKPSTNPGPNARSKK